MPEDPRLVDDTPPPRRQPAVFGSEGAPHVPDPDPATQIQVQNASLDVPEQRGSMLQLLDEIRRLRERLETLSHTALDQAQPQIRNANDFIKAQLVTSEIARLDGLYRAERRRPLYGGRWRGGLSLEIEYTILAGDHEAHTDLSSEMAMMFYGMDLGQLAEAYRNQFQNLSIRLGNMIMCEIHRDQLPTEGTIIIFQNPVILQRRAEAISIRLSVDTAVRALIRALGYEWRGD